MSGHFGRNPTSWIAVKKIFSPKYTLFLFYDFFSNMAAKKFFVIFLNSPTSRVIFNVSWGGVSLGMESRWGLRGSGLQVSNYTLPIPAHWPTPLTMLIPNYHSPINLECKCWTHLTHRWAFYNENTWKTEYSQIVCFIQISINGTNSSQSRPVKSDHIRP